MATDEQVTCWWCDHEILPDDEGVVVEQNGKTYEMHGVCAEQVKA